MKRITHIASLVIAALAGAAALAAGQADAASTHIKHPKLKDGVLSIEGSKSSDRIVLRLQAGDPGTLQLDVGDDGFDLHR